MKRFILLSLAVFFSITSFAGQKVTMLTYNVENLFDSSHDRGKTDYTYLPLVVKQSNKKIQSYCASQSNYFYKKECYELDWSPEVVQTKIRNIAQMILTAQVDGPDIIVLNEVENINVVSQLVGTELANLGYQTVELLEGPDKRGIDVAIISKFAKTKKAKLHIVNLDPVSNGRSDTRGILEVQLNIGGKAVSIFANHWPSMANPDTYREVAAMTLSDAAEKSGTPYVFALGDFNSNDDQASAGINTITLNPENPNFFYDARLNTTVYADSDVGGSHFYRGKWQFLDKILLYNKMVSANPLVGLEYLRIVSPAFALKPVGSGKKQAMAPARFDSKNGTGYSDHLPLYLSLEIQ